MSNLQIRFAELPIAAASETFYDLTGYADRLTSTSPDEIGQAKAHKALERALKARTPKRWKPPKLNAGVIGASLPRGGAGSQDPLGAAQRRAYEEATGRRWEDVDAEPTSEAYGCPPHPPYPQSEHHYSPGYMGKRSTKADDERRAAWRIEYDAWQELADAWKTTPAHAAFLEARDRWEARRDQFAYTGRARSDANVLAMCAESLPLEVAA